MHLEPRRKKRGGINLSNMSDIEPLLNQRQLQKRLRLAKEKKNWTVVQMKVNLAFHLEIKVLDSGGRVERLGV